ncbi:1,4-alpha-glucan branching protein GlgB [Psychromonas sp. Urea-02u-13]|uniref:1,4-alpha-glucan branching protein GlgB n=1 Tax=Psychromonas sp. Urea-02u-13 TaxID=2058326 RepID=UPI000C322FC2|nr:1,4-alpha-glucan branching protein GlgB [Psychromonas sp. Urea-02u-13]PKG40247.1 1,4-alpha-glucan branching enzyme [Psychromonas sp. Urea-02u-13]
MSKKAAKAVTKKAPTKAPVKKTAVKKAAPKKVATKGSAKKAPTEVVKKQESLHVEHSSLINLLKEAKLDNPFERLGLLPATSGGYILRVWLPDAQKVELFELGAKKAKAELLKVDDAGLFELALPTLDEKFTYELNAHYQDAQNRFIDPYQFHDIAFDGLSTLKDAPQNVYKTLGAQLKTVTCHDLNVSGVRFIVYAPNASSVSLITELNHWDGQRQPMQRSWCGHWVLFVPGLEAGCAYKFELKDGLGNRLPHKADPVGFQAEQYPSHSSIVVDHDKYQWNDSEWRASQSGDKRFTAMSIYEVHLGSWKRKNDQGVERMLSYRELAADLIPYLVEMGYTHLEVMPISEFPFDGSWGYQPVGLFAATSRFGDADDLKYFIDIAHQAGIGIIVDWVPAHFPADPHGLARFDGTPLYEYEDPRRGWHPDWNSYIYDFGRDNVRQFLVASALIWLDKFHVDGLRVDAVASMLYWDYSREEGEWVPNVDGGNHNYESISLLKWFNEEVYGQYPHAMTIAEESTAFTGVSKPTFEGGLGFGFKWNMGWMHDTLSYVQQDPMYRKHHHHEMTFSMVYHYNEHFVLPISHDEVVHGKKSMIDKMPGDEWQASANLRAYSGFMYAHPGKKLNFMGAEIAQSREWNHDCSLDWDLLEFDKHAGQQQLIKDLNHLYKANGAFYELDYSTEGFEWLDHSDGENSVFSFIRHNKDQDKHIICISNFTPIPREGYRIPVSELGEYEVILNTDSHYYWGSNFPMGDTMGVFVATEQEWQGKDYSFTVDLPPLSTVYLQKKG